ncbi:MAG: tetratricopeptide repeat protein, partial [Methanotrichaceae archaeon]
MSIMSDMAKNDAYYKGKKLIGCVFDPTGFKKPDGSLDSAAMADEMFKWAQSQFKKIDDAKKAEWSNKGIALGNQGKYDEAVQAYDKAIEINPRDASAWNSKGNALSSQGKYDES